LRKRNAENDAKGYQAENRRAAEWHAAEKLQIDEWFFAPRLIKQEAHEDQRCYSKQAPNQGGMPAGAWAFYYRVRQRSKSKKD
jgi:hypothetical protein